MGAAAVLEKGKIEPKFHLTLRGGWVPGLGTHEPRRLCNSCTEATAKILRCVSGEFN